MPSRVLFGLLAFLTAMTLIAPAPSWAAGTAHPTVVNAVPGSNTPDLVDGTVFSLAQVGPRMYAGGSFTQVRNHGQSATIDQPHLVAFDQATGAVDTSFAPVLDDEVDALATGPDNTIYVGGQFTTVNGVATQIVRLDASTGALVGGWKAPILNGQVNSLALVAGKLFVAGNFARAGMTSATLEPHAGLIALSPSTGGLLSYVDTQVSGHHAYTPTNGWLPGRVGIKQIDVSPDATQLMAVGNFTQVDGVERDQIVRFNLGTTKLTVDTTWATLNYTALCSKKFDSTIRDVRYSPDGTYFVVVSTGGGGLDPVNDDGTRTSCDSINRYETGATGPNVRPTWNNYTGNDTLWSVEVTGSAVYAGGHQRWSNNDFGDDTAGAGAIPSPGIVGLDPDNGLPLDWNPGRHPRGVGAFALLATADGLYVGSDTRYVGNRKYYRGMVAFFPLQGGAPRSSTVASALPGTVYQAGGLGDTAGDVLYRLNAGGPAVPATDGGPRWAADDADSSAYRAGGTRSFTESLAGVSSSVPSAVPQQVFSTGRYDVGVQGDGKEMHYAFPVPAGTEVAVRLYLSDPTAEHVTGSRVFDVSFDGVTMMDNLDLVAVSGSARLGIMREATLASDGQVDIDFLHEVQNPVVNAIEIVRIQQPIIDGSKPIYRINAGGPQVPSKDAQGPAWLADSPNTVLQGTPFRVGGTSAAYTSKVSYDATVPTATTPMAVFKDEQFSITSERWSFPVTAGTPVTVRLFWANQAPATSTAGKRKFHVGIDGKRRLTNFDIVATAMGDKRATMKSWSLPSDGRIDVKLSRGSVGNPTVSAIEILQTGASPVPVIDTTADSLVSRSYDGVAVGATTAETWGSDWHQVRGAFVLGKTLFYGKTDGYLYQRSIVGSNFGPESRVDPYNNTTFSKVLTGSQAGQTYRGALPIFYTHELAKVTSLFYSDHKIFFTLDGDRAMHWRYFTPDSGAVGTQLFTVDDGLDWRGTAGAFLSGSTLYFAEKADGVLHSIGWTPSGATGDAAVADTSTDWASRALFLVSDG